MARTERLDVSMLTDLNTDALRAAWRTQLGSDPPPLRAPELLRRELAARLQAREFGGIDAALKQRLDRLTRRSGKPSVTLPKAARPSVGSTLIREWNGRSYSVVVLKDGFLFQGETYGSLSEIARIITGARWSGPRFVGIAAR